MKWLPYVYVVKNKTTGLFYYGVKISKRDANPDFFWKTYFTSSKYVKQLIEMYGVEDFDYEIRKTFDNAKDAVNWERKVIRRMIKHEKCLNLHHSGDVINNNVPRKIPDDNGFTSYDIGGAKTKETKLSDIDEDGLNAYQRAYAKALENNPELHNIRTQRRHETMSTVGEDGLTTYQRMGLLRKGDANPATRPDVRKKISEANSGKVRSSEAITQMLDTRKKLGLDKKHSERMTGEGNPCYNTIWINNGVKNKRIREDEIIPSGYSVGRLFATITCPHCGKTGQVTNMKRFHMDNCKSKKNDR